MNHREILRASELLLAEELAATLRHRQNNHIAAVRNSAFYIRQKVTRATTLSSDDPRVGAFFELIDRELVSASNALPAQARARTVQAGKLQASMVGSLLWPLVGDARCELRILVDEPVQVPDELGLAVALRCLMANAVEALEPAGGVVTLSSQRTAGGGFLEVRNDGNGFEPEVLERAREPFFSTREGHLGVGLNVAARAIALNGGRLELQQEPGGAVARLLLAEVG